MKNQASCQFCSKPDDSIQVVCESRCLLCSKCQLVPAIRKLLIDHTLFSDDPSIQGSQTEKGAIEPKIFDDAPYRPSTTTGNNIQGGGVSSTVALALKGHCPICSAAMSLSMLLMIQSYREAFKVLNEDQMMVRVHFLLICHSQDLCIGCKTRRAHTINPNVSQAISPHI